MSGSLPHADRRLTQRTRLGFSTMDGVRDARCVTSGHGQFVHPRRMKMR